MIFVSDNFKDNYLIPSPNIFLILPQFFRHDLVRTPMFNYGFRLGEVQILWTVCRPDPTFFNDAHLSMHNRQFRAWLLNQCFIVVYSRLIFLWFLSAQIALVLVLNQRFLIVRASLIFCMRGMSRHFLIFLSSTHFRIFLDSKKNLSFKLGMRVGEREPLSD